MRAKGVTGLAVACALVGWSGAAMAQSKPKKVQVAVMDFDFGTVGNHWWGDADIGKGMADQVMGALVEDGTFRVIERKRLDTILAEQDFAHSNRADPGAAKMSKIGKVLGVRYVITGSITKFGGEEKNFGGGGLIGGKLGGLGLKKAKTYVNLTARLVDTTTGEIVAQAKGEGLSTKGGGLTTGAAGGGGGAGFHMGTSDYKESAIGDAQEMACNDLVKKLVAKAASLEP